MQTRSRRFVLCHILFGYGLIGYGLVGPAAFAADGSLPLVLARMDQAARNFKTMTAQVTYITHTDVLNENDTETGAVTMKKVQPGEVQGRVDFTAPDRKTVTIEKRRVQEYFPKINTLQVFDLDRHGEQLDKFFMIGFGTSGMELAKDYDVTVTGTEDLKGQSAIRLRLSPKAAEARQYIQTIELWIPSEGDPYPLREKIFEPSHDYRLVTYTDLKINPPLQPDALQLKLPSDVKTEYPGK
jgi:outer membrane lipoprotein-sorting protein